MMTLEPDTLVSPPAKPRRWVRLLLTLIVLLLLAMWIYAFVFASKKGVYRVDSNEWRANSRTVCAAAQEQRLRLVDMDAGYIENPTNAQMLQRADVVDQATDILEQQLDDLVAFPVTSERDRELVASFEGFYRTLISDRRAYTARLRAFDLQPYRETLLVKGGPVTNALTDFTSGNDIKACAPPGELGGDTAG
jgi:hypothetical protein